MIDFNIEDLARKYVNFRHGVANQGWNLVFCEYCGDGKRTKGARGGWLFNDGGNSCVYHCFNCGCKESCSTEREVIFSKNMRSVLDSFGIPSKEYNALLYNQRKNIPKKDRHKYLNHTVLDLPDHFRLVSELEAEVAKPFKSFLKKEYNLSTKHYSFYVATGLTSSKDVKILSEAKLLKDRLIIPYFKNGKLIYYQARDITKTSKLKYISPVVPKNNILFNIDQLHRSTTEPLYVVEGAFDAIHLNGVATLGNELSFAQKELLSSSHRRKILVPDFKGDSNRLIEDFIDMGWDISFPAYRTKCKDVSEAVINYGKLYTAYDIVKNIKSAEESNMLLTFLLKM